MKFNIKNLKKIENTQKRWDKFQNEVIYYFNENKDTIKGQTLKNGMTITGIGQKCLKIENNFYNWEDIENCASEVTEADDIMENILEFIFEDYKITTKESNYKPRKFTRTEATKNWEEIKEEIIEHKSQYKIGNIAGIGQKCISINIGGGYKEYINWETIINILKRGSIKDYKLLHKPSVHEEDPLPIIDALFTDDEEEYTVEQNLREKKEEYSEEKGYIYRHIVNDDLTVENIRTIVYNRYGHEGRSICEKLINTLLQFAFQYTDEVKVTDEPVTEEEDHEYARKNKKHYIIFSKDQELTYEEDNAYFTDDDEVTFKIKDISIVVYREGKKVHTQFAGKKPLYIDIDGLIYELSTEQQVDILLQLGDNIRQVSDEEIREDLKIKCTNGTDWGVKIALLLREQGETFDEAYEKYDSLRALARELYKDESIIEPIYFNQLRAVISERYIDTSRKTDFIIWDDSDNSNGKATVMEEKYGFANTTSKIIFDGVNEYSYSQNCEYTRITQTSSYIDSFTVAELYIEGDVSEEEAIHFFNYHEGMESMNDMKRGFIYENSETKLIVKY